MKKLFNFKKLLAVTLLYISASGVINAYEYFTSAGISRVLLQNTEALAEGDVSGEVYKQYKFATVWYNAEVPDGDVVYEKPSFWGSSNWESIVCCVNAGEFDVCDLNREDGECMRRLDRVFIKYE